MAPMPTTGPQVEPSGPFQPVLPGRMPVYRRDGGEYALFYAPGCLCVVGLSGADPFERFISPLDPGNGQSEKVRYWGRELWKRAERAVNELELAAQEPYRPECLTLYLNNECNLRCTYCYADPSSAPETRLVVKAIAAAAELVAANCRAKSMPFYVVLHGGGEPTLHPERVEEVLALVGRVAAAHDVELYRYVATNGILSEERAAWLARNVDQVGLSCDGPAAIHDRQRPCRDGWGSLRLVERAARVFHEEGVRLHVRATITAASLERQAEVADYICRQIEPEEVRFEPVYLGGRQAVAGALTPHHADAFVSHFLAARVVARGYGIPLLFSGSRLDSIHGPYCNVFRQVLNLVPGGVATACFKAVDARQVVQAGMGIGGLDRDTGTFVIDKGRVALARWKLGEMPARCADCFNRYHCAGSCPDGCRLDGDAEAGFRCQVQQSLSAALLVERAGSLWSELQAEATGAAGGIMAVHGTTSF